MLFRSVTANGGNSTSGNYGSGGGGAGGAIHLICSSLRGSANGILRANGGNGDSSHSGGGGGGGRIAVWIDVPPHMQTRYLEGEPVRAVVCSTNWPQFGTTAVTNGTGIYDLPNTNGAYPGTCFFFKYVKGARLGIQ